MGRDKRNEQSAEVIPPDRLCAILLDAITSRQDQDDRTELLDQEDLDRTELHDIIRRVV